MRRVMRSRSGRGSSDGAPSVLSIAATLALTSACRRPAPAAVTPERPNVLLVTIDTLRADHVGAYGYGRRRPRRSMRWPPAACASRPSSSHAPLTGPSHASILTGLTPLGHGFRNNGGFILPPSVRTAAEDFRQAGYRTGAVISGFPLDRRFGFDRGFDAYEDHLPRGNDARRTPYVERPADATTDVALRWLDAPDGQSRRWFLWVHYYDPHAPYEAPGGPGRSVSQLAVRRRDRVRGPGARPAATGTRRETGKPPHAGPRHGRPRREPRRAWRRDPRRVPLRRHAARAVDHGRTRPGRRSRRGHRGAIDRRAADAARLRRPFPPRTISTAARFVRPPRGNP